MIEFAKSYKVGGKCFGTLGEAQVEEILKIMLDGDPTKKTEREIADLLVAKKDAVIDILTTTDTSRPRARRVNGGSKKRKPAPTVSPVQPQAA